MDIGIAVGVSCLLGIYVREPVVCRYLTGGIEDKSSQRIAGVSVFVHTPVGFAKVFAYGLLYLYGSGFAGSELGMARTVQNIRLCHGIVSMVYEGRFYRILDSFYIRNRYARRFYFANSVIGNASYFARIQRANHMGRGSNRIYNSQTVERSHASVSFAHLKNRHIMVIYNI